MKKQNLLWLLLCVLAFAACSDNGIDDPDQPTKDNEENNTDPDPTEKDYYLTFEGDYKEVDASGGSVTIVLSTNLDSDNIDCYYYDASGMVDNSGNQSDGSANTRVSGDRLGYKFNVLANTDTHSRSIMVVAQEKDNEELADTIVVIQDGTALRTSTDFSKDKTQERLLTHSQGSGIPIIVMGDGFGDTEVNGSEYKTAMQKAVDNLFSEQPMETLKPYFDVYMVNVVSKQNDVGQCYDTALQTIMPSDGTTEVTGNDSLVQDYADVVADEYKWSQTKYNNALIVVVINNHNYAGTTYFYSDKRGNALNFSICYCPIIEGLDSEYFRTVLVHEAVGHGFAKLADEYYYDENGAITSDAISELKSAQKDNWFMNVSTSQFAPPWKEFMTDTDYSAGTEAISAYEGAYTYTQGAYRPSDKSMMNGNDYPFNAPSRKLIYDKVLEQNSKSASTYTVFKEFDQANQPDFARYKTEDTKSRAALSVANRHFAKPKFKRMK